MPASRIKTYYDGFEITAKPVEGPSPAFWTKSTPTFEIQFSNSEDSMCEWSDDCSIRVGISVDGERVWTDTVDFGPIGYGESDSAQVTAEPLTLEGHGVLGVGTSGVTDLRNETPSTMNEGRKDMNLNPIYTFGVLDKSQYEATVEKPKQLQRAIILTSVVLIAFAAVQIWLAL